MRSFKMKIEHNSRNQNLQGDGLLEVFMSYRKVLEFSFFRLRIWRQVSGSPKVLLCPGKIFSIILYMKWLLVSPLPLLNYPIHLPLNTIIYQNPSKSVELRIGHITPHGPISAECRVTHLHQSGWCRLINPDKNDISFLSSCLMLLACLNLDMN